MQSSSGDGNFAKVTEEGWLSFPLSVVASGSAMCGGSLGVDIQIFLFDQLDAGDYVAVRNDCSRVYRVGGHGLEHAGTALFAVERGVSQATASREGALLAGGQRRGGRPCPDGHGRFRRR